MKVAIVGSRDFKDLDLVREYVKALPEGTMVISGGARGVDSVAEETAKSVRLTTLVFPANWKEHGKSAGYIRNAFIVNAADRVVAFWDGKSKGTLHSMELARKTERPLEVVYQLP